MKLTVNRRPKYEWSAAEVWRIIRFITGNSGVKKQKIKVNEPDGGIKEYTFQEAQLWFAKFSQEDVWIELILKDPLLNYYCEKKKIKSYEDIKLEMFRYCEKYEITYGDM